MTYERRIIWQMTWGAADRIRMNKNKYRVITFTALSQTGRHMFKSSRPHALVTELMRGCRSALQRLLQAHEVFGGWGGPPSTSANTPLASHIYLRRSPIALPPSLGKGGGGGGRVRCVLHHSPRTASYHSNTGDGEREKYRKAETEWGGDCVCVSVCAWMRKKVWDEPRISVFTCASSFL